MQITLPAPTKVGRVLSTKIGSDSATEELLMESSSANSTRYKHTIEECLRIDEAFYPTEPQIAAMARMMLASKASHHHACSSPIPTQTSPGPDSMK